MSSPDPSRPGRARRVVPGLVVLLMGAVGAFALLRRSSPPPAAIATDPVLVRGYEIYSNRCASCHGSTGRGDGPSARNLPGPAPRNLVEEPWKYGDAPEQVLAVIGNGIKGSAMPGYGGLYNRADLHATAAYLYHLTERSVPAQLRIP